MIRILYTFLDYNLVSVSLLNFFKYNYIFVLVIRRKTIYEYHRIDMKKEEIGNHTAIYFTSLTSKNFYFYKDLFYLF